MIRRGDVSLREIRQKCRMHLVNCSECSLEEICTLLSDEGGWDPCSWEFADDNLEEISWNASKCPVCGSEMEVLTVNTDAFMARCSNQFCELNEEMKVQYSPREAVRFYNKACLEYEHKALLASGSEDSRLENYLYDTSTYGDLESKRTVIDAISKKIEETLNADTNALFVKRIETRGEYRTDIRYSFHYAGDVKIYLSFFPDSSWHSFDRIEICAESLNGLSADDEQWVTENVFRIQRLLPYAIQIEGNKLFLRSSLPIVGTLNALIMQETYRRMIDAVRVLQQGKGSAFANHIN